MSDNALVRQCLDKIVNSPAFRQSARSRNFLEYVVRLRLEGRGAEIKERTIGVELFGRPADFDTSSDAIVRVNANEVRKRLAQYYAEAGVTDPVHISLPQGSYVPEFSAESQSVPYREAAPAAQRNWIRVLSWATPLAAVLGYFAWSSNQSTARARTPVELFWSPMVQVGRPVILALPSTRTATPRPTMREPFTPERWTALRPSDLWFHKDWHTSLPVLTGAIAVSGWMARHGMDPVIRMGEDLKADELRSNPVVSFGSFSSPWAERVTRGFRFTFGRGPSDTGAPEITDREDPARRWKLEALFPAERQTKDYAIVTRVLPPLADHPFVFLAGLHSFGNQIAGEFAVSESSWKAVAARAPAGWEKMHVQIVLEGEVVGIAVGPPKVLAMHFWK